MGPTSSTPASIANRFSVAAAAAGAIYLLFATTTGFNWIESWHDEQRAIQIVLLCAVGLGASALSLANPATSQLRFAPVVLLTLTLGVVSSVLTNHRLEALAEVGLFGLLCVFANAISTFVRAGASGAALWIGRAALLIVGAHAVGAFARYAAAFEVEQSLGTEIWLLGFSNPRVASAFYALVIPLAALSTVPRIEPDRRIRIAAWAALIAVWAVATGLQARALWLSYALALPALVFLLRSPSTHRLAMTVGLTAFAGALLQVVLPLPTGTASAAFAARDLADLSGRDTLWRLAIAAAVEHPLFGLGPGQFARIGSYIGAHPHNWMLQLAAEWGLPVLIVALAGLLRIALLLASPPAPRRDDDGLRAGACLSVTVALASALVDGTLVMPSTQTAFAVAFGVMLGTIAPVANRSVSDGSLRSLILRGWTPAIAVLLLSGWLAFYAFSTYALQEPEKAAFRQMFPEKWLVPRFWECGLHLVQNVGATSR